MHKTHDEYNCEFCRAGKKKDNYKDFKEMILLKDQLTTSKSVVFPCKRLIYEHPKKRCFATLAPEQYSYGHTLVFFTEKVTDMCDKIDESGCKEICETINYVSNLLKNKLNAERVYVCSLCDGLEHLHFHLIPRYKNDDTGFKFIGDREKMYNRGITEYGLAPISENFEKRAKWIEDIANLILKEEKIKWPTT